MKWRWMVLPVALALVVGAGLWTRTSLSGRPSSSNFSPGPAVTYRNPRFGWTIRFPRTLQLGHFQSNGMFDSDGIRLTSFEPDLSAPSSGEPQMGWLRSFPPDGVALQIWFGQRLPLPPTLQDTSLPMPFDSLKPTTRYVGGDEPIPRYRWFSASGKHFFVAVWFGPQASAAGRSAIESVLDSLRFPHP
jgi:hypothetical protein